MDVVRHGSAVRRLGHRPPSASAFVAAARSALRTPPSYTSRVMSWVLRRRSCNMRGRFPCYVDVEHGHALGGRVSGSDFACAPEALAWECPPWSLYKGLRLGFFRGRLVAPATEMKVSWRVLFRFQDGSLPIVALLEGASSACRHRLLPSTLQALWPGVSQVVERVLQRCHSRRMRLRSSLVSREGLLSGAHFGDRVCPEGAPGGTTGSPATGRSLRPTRPGQGREDSKVRESPRALSMCSSFVVERVAAPVGGSSYLAGVLSLPLVLRPSLSSAAEAVRWRSHEGDRAWGRDTLTSRSGGCAARL